MPPRAPRLSIIGAGTVGTALGTALAASGHRVVSVVSRTGSRGLALAKQVRCERVSTSIADLAPETELLLIAVPDAAVAEVARAAASVKTLGYRKLFAVHTSGVHGADALAPLRRKGTAVAAFHPVQTFPRQLSAREMRARLRGICYGIDGDALALAKAEDLAAALGGTTVVVPAELRALYHAACVFASSSLVVLTNAISEISSTLPLQRSWTEVFGPLMTASMEHAIRNDAAKVLTGPILRRDDATVDAHLEALARSAPHLLGLYAVSGIEVARLAKRGGTLSTEDVARLVRRFRQFIKTQPSTTLKVTS